MTQWSERIADISELLLDRQIVGADGQPAGKVDDLEFAEPPDGGAPVLTAILCGPTALGPRVGGLLGLMWWAVGRRLRPDEDPYPIRIPFDLVESVDRKEIRLSTSGERHGTYRLRDWTRDKIVARIPGGTT